MNRSPGKLLAAISVLSLAACSSGASSPPTASNTSSQTQQASVGSAQVTLRLLVPPRSLAALRKTETASAGKGRAPSFVSPSTLSLTVSVSAGNAATPGPTQVFACTSTCEATVTAPIGSDTIALALYSGANATGNVLSLASTPIIVRPNVLNSFSLTAGGVVHGVTLSLSASTVPAGTPNDVTLTVNATDASGNTIIGPGNYVDVNGNPVTITLAATNTAGGGAISLSQSSFSTAPMSPVTAHYDGNWLDHGTISVSSPAALVGTAPVIVTTIPRVTEYSNNITPGSTPFDITNGPDGALWFTESTADQIGRITTAGAVTEFGGAAGLSPFSEPRGIVTGPDGRIWFSEHNVSRIAALTIASGTVAEYGGGSNLRELVVGPDNVLWGTEDGNISIDRYTTTPTVTYYNVGSLGGDSIGITNGPDGNLWYTEQANNVIGVITPAGNIIHGYAVSGNPRYIVQAPDGTLWFSQSSASCIGQITTSGTVTNHCMGITSFSMNGIVVGPDGKIYVAESDRDQIAAIDPTTGVVTELLRVPTGITAGSNITGMVIGPDHNLWFTENGISRIGKLTL